MDQTPDVFAMRMHRIDPVKYPLPKVEVPKPGAYAHMSISELRAAINSPITAKD